MDFQAVFTEIGQFGRYQKFILSVLSLPHLLAASYIYIQVLTIQDTEHHCNAWPNETCGGLNISETECGILKRDLSIPFTQNTFGNATEEDQCHKYNVTGISLATAYSSDDWINSTDIIDCDEGWVFNRTSSSSSIIIDFDLVCDKSYLAKLAQSAFFAGSLAGSFIAGAAADIIGRRKTQLLCYVTSAAVGVATAFSTTIWMYMILRFCSAMLLRGIGLADFVLINELVAPSKRVLVGNLLWVFWAFGYMVFAAIAKFLTNWRILEITISLPMMLALIVTYIFVPESPRWLITKRKPEKAAKILKKIAKVNGKIVSDEYIDGVCRVDECQSSDKVKGTFRDLIRSPVVLLIFLNMCFNWCVQSLVYYGLSLSTSELGVDPFLSFMISGVVEIPAYLCCMFVADVLGRKRATFATMLLAGVSCSVAPLIDAGVWRLIVVMAGKFGITMSFSLVYTWAVELVPTSLRSIGLGVFSLTSRIGSVVAPLILLLGDVWKGLPYFIFGGAATLAGLLCLLLPETKGKPLPTTIQDTEQLARKLEKLREPPSLLGIENPSWKGITGIENEGGEKETLGETSEERI